MSITAPYVNGMRLGQAFNTYTHEIRIENGVRIKINAPLTPEKNLVVPSSGLQSPPESRPATPSVADKQNVVSSREPTAGDALFNRPKTASDVPFELNKNLPADSSQSVTFSTRAIDNVSDIMDALNISTAMSIKYGTIHGNASGSFVNETKVLDSQLNYVVSVKVNNGSAVDPEEMDFQPIDGLPRERFTEVYGDSFISGFLEGGEFNAVISIKVHDKRKLRVVKQAVDVQLAIGPSPVSVGAGESISKDHSEALQDTEITISVNWCGGGEIKKPEEPWTLASVIAVANAFPSMVARCSARTSAILTRYTSLRSFQTWRWKMAAHDPEWMGNFILNYEPCTLYTADLFDALMAYKKLWKKISSIMRDTSKWKAVEPAKEKRLVDYESSTALVESPRENRANTKDTVVARKAASASPERATTFDVNDPMVPASWDLDQLNKTREPIPLDPVALNEARLLCREAMTLITEEAARLVNHPQLAYAEFDGQTKKTRMKRPNYAYPEVLRMRLPIYVGNDAALDDDSDGPLSSAAKMTQGYGVDLYCHMAGDAADPHRHYKPFTSLSLSEHASSATAATPTNRGAGALKHLSIHGYRHHFYSVGRFSAEADGAIGALGFRFAGDEAVGAARLEDGCTAHVGRPALKHYRHHEKPGQGEAQPFKARDLDGVDVRRVDVGYVPGTGRIASLAFFDSFAGEETERLAWRQWGVAGKEPEGLRVVRQEPPDDGSRWVFVGLCGEFEGGMWGEVLARVAGVWRKV